MKIEEIRSSFTVFTIGSNAKRLQEVADALGSAGYMVASFTQLTAAFSELASNPPHFVVFDFSEEQFNLVQAINQVQEQLPESHIYIASKVEDRPRAAILLDRGVYDVIYLPAVQQSEVTFRFDHAAERDYLMYLNERLMESHGDSGASPAASAVESAEPQRIETAPDLATLFMQELFQLKSFDDCIQLFLETIAGHMGSVPAVYFKYFANRRVLVAASGQNLKGLELQGLGIDFNQLSPKTFRSGQLREPEQLSEIRSFVEDMFETKTYMAFPIEALGDIQGVALFMGEPLSESTRESYHTCARVLENTLSLFEAQKRLHSTSVKDVATDVYNRVHFQARAVEEVARARRTNLPVAMILLALDQFGAMVAEYGTEEGNVILRMLVKIIEKHSRINDVIARVGSDEFGIVLPHTSLKGALIKAERLRRIIESADFTKVLGAMPNLTVSVGVSEYPSLCRDSDELMQTADEALYHVREEKNKVCVAKAPEGFAPDFLVNDKGP